MYASRNLSEIGQKKSERVVSKKMPKAVGGLMSNTGFSLFSDTSTRSPLKTSVDIDPRIKVVNPTDLLRMPEVVQLRGDFTEEMAEEFAHNFNMAEASGQEVIPIIIDSYGGDVYALMGIIDIIRASKAKIATICLGKAMSAGAVVLSCGHDGLRFASPHSTIMIHSASGGAFGTAEEVKVNTKELMRVNNKLLEIMSVNCGHKKDHFLKLLHSKKNTDLYLTPAEAKKHKIVNEIRIPEFEISVKATVNFK